MSNAREPMPDGSPLPAPNAGELDVLGVLWAEQQDRPMQLSEIYRHVCERRRRFGEPEPALSTVSTHLRKLVAKGLLEETTTSRRPAAGQAILFRGGYAPPARSPATGYRVRHRPGQVLLTTFQGLAAAYPTEQRLDALLDFARALDLPDALVARLGRLVQQGKSGLPRAREGEG